MKKIIALLAALSLSGCMEVPPPPVADQCLRAQLFQACMKSLPAGPVSTQYNDWDEVVDSCSNTAYYQSLRRAESIKPECRP